MTKQQILEIMGAMAKGYDETIKKISFTIAMYELGIYPMQELIKWLKTDKVINAQVERVKEEFFK